MLTSVKLWSFVGWVTAIGVLIGLAVLWTWFLLN
jgi:hypothetical protein